MKYFVSTGKIGAAGRKYRLNKTTGVEAEDQSGGWYKSHHTKKSLEKFVGWGFLEEIKCKK